MRILIINQWFTPEPNLKSLAFARALADRGHQVQVLTGFPNYPGGKVYPGYRIRLLQREMMDGISVLRVPLFPSHDRSAIRRIWNYVSFALSASLLGLLFTRKADVIYVYHPPATIALPALVIGKLRRAPVVYDIQDLWPDTLRATEMVGNPTILKLVEYWCKLTYRCAKRVVVLSTGFKELLIERGVPGGKIEVIYNWTLEDDIMRMERDEVLARELGMAGKFNIVFAGTMGRAQSLETVVLAAERLQQKIPQLQIVLAGGGVETQRLKSLVHEKGLSNVLFLPWCPVSEIAKVLSLANALLVHLKKDPLFRITIPSKIQTYLAVGRPLLVGVEGDAARLVLKAGAGFAYDPGSDAALAKTIERMVCLPRAVREEMGENGYEFYHSELSFSKGVERFERVFLDAAKERKSDVTTAGTIDLSISDTYTTLRRQVRVSPQTMVPLHQEDEDSA